METKERKDWWWVFGGVVLIALLVVAVILNFNSNSLGGTDGIKIDNGDTKIVWEEYPSYIVELKESYDITAPGTYYLSGEIKDGGISVRVADNAPVRLVLDNVKIKNSNGPAIACAEGDDLVIVLNGENYLEDGANYDTSYDEDVKGAIYSKADLTFSGDGKMVIKANHQDGIVSKDDLKFDGGIYDIVAADDGIRGKDSVYILDGEFSITAKGDGIKSTNENDINKGFVLIENGKIKISAGDDGIHAYNRLAIEGGEIKILQSYEGLEAQKIYIEDGDIEILANDDGINAGGGADSSSANARPGAFDVNENCELVINGGSVYINAAGDGVDSNGYIYFNGGEVVVDGPTNNGNGALDAGAKIVMHGGKVVAVGASGMAEGLGNESTIYNMSIFFQQTYSKDTKVEIKDSDDNVIISHTSAKSFSHLAVGTTDFELGKTYTIYINGEKYQTVMITSIVTLVGRNNQSNGMGMPGGPRR